MGTLTTAPLAPLLDRLFAEVDAAEESPVLAALLRTLAADLPEAIDLLLLDGAKSLYPEVLRLVEGRLRPGALVVADDADNSPEYLARVRSPAQGYLSLPFGEDVELSLRLG